jgi:hypothetical protein
MSSQLSQKLGDRCQFVAAAVWAGSASAAIGAPRIWYGGHHSIAHCVYTIGNWCPLESLGASLVGTLLLTLVFGGASWVFYRLGGPGAPKSAARAKDWRAPLPSTFYYKSPTAAFDMHCKYGRIDPLEEGALRLGITISSGCRLKSGSQWLRLLVADKDGGFFAYARTAVPSAPQLDADCLVYCYIGSPEPEFASAIPDEPRCWRHILVVAVLAPEQDTASGHFRIVADYRDHVASDPMLPIR